MSSNEEEYDSQPAYIDMSSAVEVLTDNVEPMDDDVDEGVQDESALQEEAAMQDEAVQTIDQSISTMTSHTDAIYAVCAHYSSSKVLTVVSGGGDDRAYLHLLSTNNNTPSIKTIPLTHPHSDSISTVSLNTPYILQDVSGKPQKELIAVGSYDGSIVLYGMDGTVEKVLEGPSDVEWCCFHPKGGTVLLAGSISDGTIWLYHLPTQTCLQVFVGHENGVTAGAFTPDGKFVLSAGQDGTLRIWAPKTGVSKYVFRLAQSGLTCLATGGGDGQLCVVGGEDGNAYVVHLGGRKVLGTLSHFEENAGGLVANNNDDMEEDEEGEARSVEAVGFCPANIPGTAHWCATGGVDGVLKIWNLNVGGAGGAQLRQKCVREEVKAGITRLKWHNSLPLVIASYTDGCVCIWDVRVGKIVQCLTGHEDMINDMDVCFVDGSGDAVIVTGSDDKTVKVFEFRPSS